MSSATESRVHERVRSVCEAGAELFTQLCPEAELTFGEEGLAHEKLVPTGPNAGPKWQWRWQLDGGWTDIWLTLHDRGPYVHGMTFLKDRTANAPYAPGGYAFGEFNRYIGRNDELAARKLAKSLIDTHRQMFPNAGKKRLAP